MDKKLNSYEVELENQLPLCDKCGKPVHPANDAVILDAIVNNEPLVNLFYGSRHLFPEGECEGSPSRAQYLGGEKDSWGYPFIKERQLAFSKAYAELLQTYKSE